MDIQIYDTYEEMSSRAAELVSAQLLLEPCCHLGMTAGKTPVGMFAQLVKLYRERGISFSKCTLYNLEEMADVGPEDPQSCRSYFHKNLLDHVDADDNQLILPNPFGGDIEAECEAYDRIMDGLPGGCLDMQILGIGSDGHIGMNRPGTALSAASHPAKSGTGRPAAAMGLRHILLAKKILLLANGTDKAKAVAGMCKGPVTTDLPASLLQLHPHVTVILDREAASEL